MKTQRVLAATVGAILSVFLGVTVAVAAGTAAARTDSAEGPVETSITQGKSAAEKTGVKQQLPELSQERPSDLRQPSGLSSREEKSEFEKYISGESPSMISFDINQFGYNLFEEPPSTFAPAISVPVGPDYVVGPGDEIRINVWGKIEESWNVVVDKDGNITLRGVGVFGVTGLSFKELKETLLKELSKIYTGFEMNVSMGSLRTIRVYVVGNAQRPGAYTISSLSTLINALFEGGGPSKTGSMRNVRVKRSGRTVVTFDLYDLLLKGDKTKDIRLLPEDVIFIPPVGPLAAIAGNVKTPAIYELKGETRLLDLLEMAGGMTGIAFKGRVQIQRIEDHHTSVLFEGDLIDIEKSPEKNFVLQDGDLVKIFMVADSAETITIAGAVAHAGKFAVEPGVTRISDIIALSGGSLYYASNQVEVTRVTVTQEGPKTDIFVIDLAKALKGDAENNVLLKQNDYILVRSVPEWSLYRTVKIGGEVKFPGTYTFKRGEKLSSLINRAGGFTEYAYPRGIEFTRERVKEQQQKNIDEMAERMERELLGAGTAQVATAASPDEARIIQLELEQKKRFIEQLKSAKAKGRIPLMITDPGSFRGSKYDIELEQNDMLFVPSNPQTVQVIGSVYNQSAFIYEPGQAYNYYVNLAGGVTPNADRGNIYILQASGTAKKAGGGLFEFIQRMNSGDTIIVPERLERIAWMRNIKDITQIIFQLAVTAGVLIAAY